MSMTDPLADMLTRIRNAGLARLDTVEVPASNLKAEVAKILVREGYIKGVRVEDDGRQGVLELDLRYGTDKQLVIHDMSRISRPGRRVYAKCDSIPKARHGLGVCIISTSRGVMTDREARQRRVGGEVLVEVW